MVLRLFTPRPSPSFPSQCLLQGSDPVRELESQGWEEISMTSIIQGLPPLTLVSSADVSAFLPDPRANEWAPLPVWGIFPRLVLNFSCPCNHRSSLRSTFGKIGGCFLVSLRLPYMATMWSACLLSIGINCWREGNAHAIQLFLRRNRV